MNIRTISLLTLLISLNACALPVITSAITGGSSILVTGKFEQALVKQGLDVVLHNETGKTSSGYMLDLLIPSKDGLTVAPAYRENTTHTLLLQNTKIYFE
jgi:hypothetical protein|tara:strand:- start:228 stop:527 length:300 start_codon:yes stop_codon:yes gene_type:complete